MTNTTRKSNRMRAVEERSGRPLEELLPEMVTDIGFSATAEALEISKPNLSYWLMKLGVRVERVCLRPGERVMVVRDEH